MAMWFCGYWLNPDRTSLLLHRIVHFVACMDAAQGFNPRNKKRKVIVTAPFYHWSISLDEIGTVLELVCRKFLGDWYFGRICRAIPIMFFHHPFARSCVNLTKTHTSCCRGVYNVSTVDGISTFYRFPHVLPSVWFPFLHRFSGRGANDWHCSGRDSEGGVVLVYATGGYPAR